MSRSSAQVIRFVGVMRYVVSVVPLLGNSADFVKLSLIAIDKVQRQKVRARELSVYSKGACWYFAIRWQ
jgi:hypothetical protein